MERAFQQRSQRNAFACRNLTGFVVGVFELPLLLQSVLAATAASAAVDIDVYAPKASGENGNEGQAAAEYSSAPQASRSTRASRWSGALQIGDASWRVKTSPIVPLWCPKQRTRAETRVR